MHISKLYLVIFDVFFTFKMFLFSIPFPPKSENENKPPSLCFLALFLRRRSLLAERANANANVALLTLLSSHPLFPSLN
jgi:hypothetical protein